MKMYLASASLMQIDVPVLAEGATVHSCKEVAGAKGGQVCDRAKAGPLFLKLFLRGL